MGHTENHTENLQGTVNEVKPLRCWRAQDTASFGNFFFDDFVRLGEKATFYAGSGADLAKSGGKEISLRQQACSGGLLPLG